MRHFIVLGFPTNSKTDPGEALYLGCNRGEAIINVNTPDKKFARKSMFELAVPQVAKTYRLDAKPTVPEVETDTEMEIENDETDVETDSDSEPPKMTAGAKELAEEHSLTDEQLAEIEPTGRTGKLTKEDVEDYLDPPDPK